MKVIIKGVTAVAAIIVIAIAAAGVFDCKSVIIKIIINYYKNSNVKIIILDLIMTIIASVHDVLNLRYWQRYY